LGSGSSGNATFLETDGFGILIDCGFSQREIANRLQAIGRNWSHVNAAILTHTHGDHWNKFALQHLRSLSIPLYLHPHHRRDLSQHEAYAPLHSAGLLHEYQPGIGFGLGPIRATSMRVCHDSEPTFAFRFEAAAWAYGHASDLGCADEHLIDMLHGVDALGVEFNHDVTMQHRSRRPRFLIDRVLSDDGHLSNEQAGELLGALFRSGGAEKLRHVIQLHLSRECNTPELAHRAGLDILERHAARTRLLTSLQGVPTNPVELGTDFPVPKRKAATAATPF
jgi:phosphoribosyl 1,2-cyclic phosphodiesterase